MAENEVIGVVERAELIATDVRELVIRPEPPATLRWAAGAHVSLGLPSGTTRDYSLVDAAPAGTIRIAVLRDPDGRGASVELHDRIEPGDKLVIRAVRSEMGLSPAASNHVFVAGGIGVTPMISMARRASTTTTPWSFHYVGRFAGHMAYTDELNRIAETSTGPAHVNLVDRSTAPRPDFAHLLDDQPTGTTVYCCGPTTLIDDVERICAERSLTFVSEHFGRRAVTAGAAPQGSKPSDETLTTIDPDGGFVVEFARSDITKEVKAGQSILEVARTIKPGLSFSCSDGYCGTCETTVISGSPDHRDTVLTDEEKKCGETMMICVSRSCTARITLDL